jgi:hypothetical protein
MTRKELNKYVGRRFYHPDEEGGEAFAILGFEGVGEDAIIRVKCIRGDRKGKKLFDPLEDFERAMLDEKRSDYIFLGSSKFEQHKKRLCELK